MPLTGAFVNQQTYLGGPILWRIAQGAVPGPTTRRLWSIRRRTCRWTWQMALGWRNRWVLIGKIHGKRQMNHDLPMVLSWIDDILYFLPWFLLGEHYLINRGINFGVLLRSDKAMWEKEMDNSGKRIWDMWNIYLVDMVDWGMGFETWSTSGFF